MWSFRSRYLLLMIFTIYEITRRLQSDLIMNDARKKCRLRVAFKLKLVVSRHSEEKLKNNESPRCLSLSSVLFMPACVIDFNYFNTSLETEESRFRVYPTSFNDLHRFLLPFVNKFPLSSILWLLEVGTWRRHYGRFVNLLAIVCKIVARIISSQHDAFKSELELHIWAVLTLTDILSDLICKTSRSWRASRHISREAFRHKSNFDVTCPFRSLAYELRVDGNQTNVIRGNWTSRTVNLHSLITSIGSRITSLSGEIKYQEKVDKHKQFIVSHESWKCALLHSIPFSFLM